MRAHSVQPLLIDGGCRMGIFLALNFSFMWVELVYGSLHNLSPVELTLLLQDGGPTRWG